MSFNILLGIPQEYFHVHILITPNSLPLNGGFFLPNYLNAIYNRVDAQKDKNVIFSHFKVII